VSGQPLPRGGHDGAAVLGAAAAGSWTRRGEVRDLVGGSWETPFLAMNLHVRNNRFEINGLRHYRPKVCLVGC